MTPWMFATRLQVRLILSSLEADRCTLLTITSTRSLTMWIFEKAGLYFSQLESVQHTMHMSSLASQRSKVLKSYLVGSTTQRPSSMHTPADMYLGSGWAVF
mmetsp:Transcript_173836/g.557141  ORF Transcript_173836/g.557141 Transcript_173836/m.557141 type:complete len:101 (+) Transcript_173836:876-1178(+)